MKKLQFFTALCCATLLFAACKKNNIEPSSNEYVPIGDGKYHESVDLGLPSGTQWATCNVGADVPEAYGNYYAWGETATKGDYSWYSYSFAGDYNQLTKYNNTDKLTTLEVRDDAATTNWGSAWRMPTDAEWTELRTSCTWTWTTLNGVNGYEVKAENGNSIFLPATGYRSYSNLYRAGDCGCYWSSSLITGRPLYVWYAIFDWTSVGRYDCVRYYGQSVRPVLK